MQWHLPRCLLVRVHSTIIAYHLTYIFICLKYTVYCEILLPSKHNANLFNPPADGEVIEMEESKLLGAILSRLNVNCAAKGINVPQLSEGGGSSNLTYEEVEFVMCEDPATEFLSENLKEKLKSSEQFYCIGLN